MPWNVQKSDQCPANKPWGVIKEGGELEGCHESRGEAIKQQRALYKSEAAKGFAVVKSYRRRRNPRL